mgnify:CR=1 FL=1
MIKVNLPENNELDRVIRNLERGNEQLALAELRSIRKQAESRYYYARNKLSQVGGIDYQVQAAQTKELKIQYEQMKDAVKTITDYTKNPEKYSFKTSRKEYFKVQRAFSRINAIQEKKQAEKELVRSEARERGTVEGVTLANIRKSRKLDALLQNVVYKNSNFNIDKAELTRIAAEVKEITGYDIMADIMKAFDTPQHYESGGGASNIPIYDTFQNITNELRHRMRSYKAAELDALEKDLTALARMFGTTI